MPRLLTLLTRFESRKAAGRKGAVLPPLLVLSDAARGFDIERQMALWLPKRRGRKGPAFIERTFGQAVERKSSTPTLCLATCLPCQARKAGIDGVHWPQKRLGLRNRSATRGLLETCSAHGGLAIAKATKLGFDAILVSTAFPSESLSATRPLGAIRLARLQRAFPHAALYALGGNTYATTKKLRHTRICGVALVSFNDI